MSNSIEARIFLANQRACAEFTIFRRFSTFNEAEDAFGAMSDLNDETLAARQSFEAEIMDNTDILIVPIVGGLEITDSEGLHDFVSVGEVQLLSLGGNMSYEIINPYNTELINFLQIRFTNQTDAFVYQNQKISINLHQKNELLPLFSKVGNLYTSFVCKYEGRKEGVHTVQKAGNGVFVFVIEGAFEVVDRLLETRDGLSLKNIETVEFEALSAEAILMIFEVGLSTN
jgi:quercetin 2,3-dioxygenase